jgi:hypothetical protein
MGELNKGSTMAVVAIASLFLLFVTLPCGIAAFYDPVVTIQWNGMPATGIGSLPSEGIVKVSGWLNSSRDVALGGHEYHGKDGYSWTWNDTDSFWIEDGTGSARVNAQGYYEIARASQRAPNALHTDGTAYYSGDNVTIVAEVHVESGLRVLHLRFIGPGDAAKAFEPWVFPLMVLTLAPSIYIIAKLAILTYQRNRRHSGAVQNAIPAEIPRDRARKPEGLDWLSSPQLVTRRGAIAVGAAIVAMAVFCFSLLWIFFVPSEKWDFVVFPTLNGLVADLALVGALFMDMRLERPPEVGFSGTGLFFWRDSPYSRLINPYFISWADIKSIEKPSQKDQRWVLTRKTNKEEISLSSLDLYVVNKMKLEWDNWTVAQMKRELNGEKVNRDTGTIQADPHTYP